MWTRVRILVADIYLHAAKKRTATDAGSSRPSRKSRFDSQLIPIREPDILSVIVPKPVIVLSALTMLSSTEVPSVGVEMVRDEDATTELSASSTIGVRAKSGVAAEPKQSTAAPAIPPGERSRTQSSTDFMATGDRRKASTTFTDDGSSVGLSTLFDIRISAGESVLANSLLAR